MEKLFIFHPWMKDVPVGVQALKRTRTFQLGKRRSGRPYGHYFLLSKLALSCGCVFHATEGLFQPNYTILLSLYLSIQLAKVVFGQLFGVVENR
jgi:hypothetical protein